MWKYGILMAFLAYYLGNLYRNTSYKSLLIYFKTVAHSSDDDMRRIVTPIQLISYTDLILTVTHATPQIHSQNAMHHTRNWTHAVVARGFPDEASRRHYTEALSALQFVEDSQAILVEEQPLYGLNFAMKAWKILGGYGIGALPATPLSRSKRSSLNFPECNDARGSDEDTPVFVLELLQLRDKSALNKYAQVNLLKLFPAIGTEIYLGGKVMGEESDPSSWTSVFVSKFESGDSLCEYEQSEVLAANIKYKEKGLSNVRKYIGRSITELNTQK